MPEEFNFDSCVRFLSCFIMLGLERKKKEIKYIFKLFNMKEE